MPVTRRTWLLFGVLSAVSFGLWLRFSYPQLEFANFSVDRGKAFVIAQDYLRARQEDPARFKTAVIFSSDQDADRYLQRSVGFSGLIQFIRTHDFDLFYWVVRFFRENEKESYKIFISSATGEVIGFQHIIEETAARAPLAREEAKRTTIEFLRKNFGFDPTQYAIKGDLETVLDNRSDFSFSWQRRDVRIPWDSDENAGTGKLLIAAKISGQEILSFFKSTFLIPDPFNRYLAKIQDTGQILSQVVHILYLVLFTSAVFFMIVRRNHLSMHVTKRFYIGLMAFSFALSIISVFNQWQNVLFDYQTAGAFYTYLGRVAIQTFTSALFLSVALFMPSLAGEALHFQVFKEKPQGSFLHYLRSTFFSREMAKAIGLGYGVWVIMLGIQAFLLHIGQRHWGVWVEHAWLSNISTAYLPFVAAFTVGFQASFAEELMYRLFALSFLKKIFGNTLAAVVISSAVWGFSHSDYPVFPMWFRGIEVTCLGIFLAWVYLRYGIIPVIVGHYLFDVFWHCAEYILSISTPVYFLSSLLVLGLPLVLAGIVFWVNKSVDVKPMRWHLNRHQRYNLEILKVFLRSHQEEFRSKTPQQIQAEMASHGWDTAVVETAMEDLGMAPPS